MVRLLQISYVQTPAKLRDKSVRDRDDMKILECVMAGKCWYIAKGDEDLLSMREYQGIEIVRCRRLLQITKPGT